MRSRLAPLVLAFTLFAAIAVGATGATLLSRQRAVSLAAIAERERILVQSRAHLIGDELARLVLEMTRLSQLAEVDLADNDLEPEKRVLAIARKDSALFSISIAVLDASGTVLWSEPRGSRPHADGALLVGLARGRGRAVLLAREAEIDVSAPIAGRGAIVGVVESPQHAFFGEPLLRTLGASGSAALIERTAGGTEFSIAHAGAVAPDLRADGRQRWMDYGGRRWLVTERQLFTGAGPDAPVLSLRLVQASDEVDDEIEAPFRRLVAIVAIALLLAVAGGAVLAIAIGRLEAARAELQKSRELAAMGKSAAAIAHEVKNSLNGLSVAIDLLASGRADPEAKRAVHTQAREEVTRLRGVADDLTLFAAPPRLVRARVDLNDLCRRTAASMQGRAAEAGVTVALDLAGGGAPLESEADAQKLLGALLNLAQNGIEAMGPGAYGEALGSPAAERERRLLIATARAGEAIVISVTDSGAGLAAEVRARLFEPFVTTKRTGTGLGLAIARRVVEAHGGRIEALDRAGGGTTFRLTLPVAPTVASIGAVVPSPSRSTP